MTDNQYNYLPPHKRIKMFLVLRLEFSGKLTATRA